MEKDGQRVCDYCGKPIPSMAKLAVKSQEGKDMCDAQTTKGLRH